MSHRVSNDKIKSWVIATSAVFLTLQVLSLTGTVVFYLFASSAQFRDIVANNVLTKLYPRNQWDWLRRERVLEVSELSIQLKT